MDINDATIHFSIIGFATTSLQIIAIIAYVIIVSKYRKSIGAKLLLAGGILSFLGIIGNTILPVFVSFNGDADDMIKSQIMASYFSTFAFLVFTLGIMLFAIKDLKKA